MSNPDRKAGGARWLKRLGRIVLMAATWAGSAAVVSRAAPPQQQNPPPENAPAQKPNTAAPQSDTVTIHIEVTAGEKEKPVEGASIYVRFTEPRKLRHDHKVEMNVKTTPQGKARVPFVPKGSVLIQVIAEGWKTFGKSFEITSDEQVIKIHLDKPHQWY